MGYKSRSNYAISQKVSDSDWDKWFNKKPITETQKDYIVDGTIQYEIPESFVRHSDTNCIHGRNIACACMECERGDGFINEK